MNVIRGINLPRTELTSKIDAYVKVKSSTFTGKTKAKVRAHALRFGRSSYSYLVAPDCASVHIAELILKALLSCFVCKPLNA